MKYKELIQFDPITEVVEFDRTRNKSYQESLVKTYVFSKAMRENLIPLMVKNIDYHSSGDAFGLHIVGNYGTGKSHLMSLVSLIAEDESLLDLIKDKKPKEDLKSIAGKFNVLRFELGHVEELWEIVTNKLEHFLSDLGLEFKFSADLFSYKEHLQQMMSEYEERFPDKGLLIVIDEMLAYLKGRSEPQKLNKDLQVLQGMGQMCNGSKFKFMFGVQEAIYESPEFQFAAEMLMKVGDRYKDIKITKDDVAFIVKNRLLQKNEHQKQWIKDHLDPFLKFFKDMHARTQDYVELFPVHPSYFENFEKIRIGKSQREILKSLSGLFESQLEQEVPQDNPGFITYDHYWLELTKNNDLLAIPDVRKVKEISDVTLDKIETHFTGGRSTKKVIAKRIANAVSIKILQAELNKQNGTTSENLVDDLCLTDPLASDRGFLLDIIDSTAQQLITATSGQYFDRDPDNGEYHLRIEGGVNFDQKIKDYGASMSESQKDEYYFKFLELNLPLDHNTYRTGFKIWDHSIEWKSHRTYREGYIFFGNPNEKSTTHPKQHFYMYFMPIFDDSRKTRNHDSDEIYFIMDDLSDGFRNTVTLFGAASALEASADSSQKPIYKSKIKELNKKARKFFDDEFVSITKVDYKGKEQPLNGFSLPGHGATKEQIFSDVASEVLESWFVEENEHYPSFTKLNSSITRDNYLRLINSAMAKIVNPDQANRDGEAILAGLGLYVPGKLDIQDSQYAKKLLKLLKDKGEGKVLNRDEILECLWAKTHLWVSKDFQIECELEFLVLAVLGALGEIEIILSSGNSINASNLEDLRRLDREDYYSFTHVKRPRGLNLAALKEMFLGFLGRDLSNQLKDQGTYTSLVAAANEWAKKTVRLDSEIRGGFSYNGIQLISDSEAEAYHRKFSAFSGFCDKLATYNTEARMKNFLFSTEEVKEILQSKQEVEKVFRILEQVQDFKDVVSYLEQCKQYISIPEFNQRIIDELKQLPEQLHSNDQSKLESYKIDLNKLREEYADYYLKQYLKYRISETDHTKKQSLLDSEEKFICEVLQDADFLPSADYQSLIRKLNKLQPADPEVTRENVLTTPYHDFNPLDFEQEGVKPVSELKVALEDILDQLIVTLKDTLDDPVVKKNMDLLDEKTASLLENFKTGSISLSKENVLKIRNTIMELHKGLEAFELDVESMKEVFNKPLSPDQAVEAFKEYIDKISSGKERNKIRIILK